jgi:hypothetical protein
MSEASHVDDSGQLAKGVIAFVPVRLHEALKAIEQSTRHLAGSCGSVLVEEQWVLALTPSHGPEIRFRGGPLAVLLQHLEGSLVHLHVVVLADLLKHPVEQRLHQLAHADHPRGQGSPRQIDADAVEDLLLAVERKRIDVL